MSRIFFSCYLPARMCAGPLLPATPRTLFGCVQVLAACSSTGHENIHGNSAAPLFSAGPSLYVLFNYPASRGRKDAWKWDARDAIYASLRLSLSFFVRYCFWLYVCLLKLMKVPAYKNSYVTVPSATLLSSSSKWTSEQPICGR